MICQTCSNPGVLNTVAGKDFYYCRTCKDEIKLEFVLMKPEIKLTKPKWYTFMTKDEFFAGRPAAYIDEWSSKYDFIFQDSV